MIRLTDRHIGAIHLDPSRITQVLPPDSASHAARVIVDAPIGFHLYRVVEAPDRITSLINREKED